MHTRAASLLPRAAAPVYPANMPGPADETTTAERDAASRLGDVPLLRREAVPGLILPDGLQVPDALLYLPDGTSYRPGRRVEVPVLLCHLEVDVHGVAVPWVSAAGAEQAERRRRRAIVDGLCGVCGFELGYRKVWHVAAADEDAVRATRVAYVPPVHPTDCSPYAAAAYPTADDLPTWAYHARKYRPRVTVDGQLVAQLAAATAVERLT